MVGEEDASAYFTSFRIAVSNYKSIKCLRNIYDCIGSIYTAGPSSSLLIPGFHEEEAYDECEQFIQVLWWKLNRLRGARDEFQYLLCFAGIWNETNGTNVSGHFLNLNAEVSCFAALFPTVSRKPDQE